MEFYLFDFYMEIGIDGLWVNYGKLANDNFSLWVSTWFVIAIVIFILLLKYIKKGERL